MPAICGDPTCQGPGCQSEALDAWEAQLQEEARAIVRGELGLPSENADQSLATLP